MKIKVICGGVHPTFMPLDVALTDKFDAIVEGDGMGVWEEILNSYHCLSNSKIIKGKRHHSKELYTRFFYSFSQKERMIKTRTTMLLSSQGCPYKCRFCASSRLQYLAYSPDEIVGMMSRLNSKYGVDNFQFFDDLFACSARRCRNIRVKVSEYFGTKNNIKYGNFVMARAAGFNEAIAEELVKMGVGCVNFGIETVSPKLLSFLNKKQTREDCYKAMRICQDFGLIRKVNLMFGIPTQDQEDYEYSLQFVKETKPEIRSCFFFAPLPGCELYDYCFDNSYLPNSYDRNRFDWFDAKTDGFADIQCRLNKVDYEMGIAYREKIEQSDYQLENLFERIKLVDRHPWVVIGSSRTYYFKKFLKKLSPMECSNCLGCINLEEEGEFLIEHDPKLQKYNKSYPNKPCLCVTYCYLGGEDFNFMRRAVDRYFGDIPLISLSSFNSHSVRDIENMTESLTI
jgi:radical SAM superfamily enzyme YgiQ (UPF0313 family)